MVLSEGSVVATDSHDSPRHADTKGESRCEGRQSWKWNAARLADGPPPRGDRAPWLRRDRHRALRRRRDPSRRGRLRPGRPMRGPTSLFTRPSTCPRRPRLPRPTRHHRPRALLLPGRLPSGRHHSGGRTPGLPPPCRTSGHRGLPPSADRRAHPDDRLERLEHLPRSPAVPPVGGVDSAHRLPGRTSTTGCGSRWPCSKSSPPS